MSIGYSVPYLDLPAPDPRVTGTGPKGAGRGAALLPAYVDAYGNVRRYGVDRGPFASAHGRWGLSGLSGPAGVSDVAPAGTRMLVTGTTMRHFQMPRAIAGVRLVGTGIEPVRAGGWNWAIDLETGQPLSPLDVRNLVTDAIVLAGGELTRVAVSLTGQLSGLGATGDGSLPTGTRFRTSFTTRTPHAQSPGSLPGLTLLTHAYAVNADATHTQTDTWKATESFTRARVLDLVGGSYPDWVRSGIDVISTPSSTPVASGGGVTPSGATVATTTTKRSIVPYAIGALGLVGAAAILLTLPPKRRR